MGFSDGIFMCALIRAFAGVMSTSIRVAMSMWLICFVGCRVLTVMQAQ